LDEAAPEAVSAAVVADVRGLAHGISSALSRCLDYVSVGTAHLCSRFARMFAMRAVSVALLFLLSCAAPSGAPAYDWGMVASAEAHASEVGAAVLRDGGNAVDAAIAVQFALAVTFPNAGNLGGGGFMLVHTA